MVLRWNTNTAFTDWKIKDNLKECLDISGGAWLSGDLAQAPVAFEFGKKRKLVPIVYSQPSSKTGRWPVAKRRQRPKCKIDD